LGRQRKATSEPSVGRHFGDHVIEVRRRPQQPEPSAAALPVAIEIDEHGDQLGDTVGVNLAVFQTACVRER